MWVGRAASPNTCIQAKGCVNEWSAGDEDAGHQLVLRECPWCKQEFGEPRCYLATLHTFAFLCQNADCEFGPDAESGDVLPLPCNVVDEALYDSPPTLLIATIDKFARLAWEERAAVFFGRPRARTTSICRPPELVIQDELHLIAGPLGSVAGLYETALETVLARRGVRPKYIASTATIRMAREQVRSLYGRELAVFPPPGLSAEDSWFARIGSLPAGSALRRLPGSGAGSAALSGAAGCRPAPSAVRGVRGSPGPGRSTGSLVDSGHLSRQPARRRQ